MMYNNNFVVVIKCNGQILREQDNGCVYLPFGSEYSILLKNKDARRALVSIEVDGEDVLNNNHLIVNGNETQEIKGFMRSMVKTNRFKFIKKTKEIQNYRGDRIDDGLVRVTYQFEKQKDVIITSNPYTITCNLPGNFYSCSSDVFASQISDATSTYNGSNICSYTSSNVFTPKRDEGITVKGKNVTQNYIYSSIGELESSIYTIVLHLKGRTKQNKVIKNELTVKVKIKCPTCGRSNKSKNKFCYNCGTHLDNYYVA